MALQKQTVAVPFTAGMQTKVAAMHVEAPQLLGLQNAKITKSGLIQKRTGFRALNNTIKPASGVTFDPFHAVFPSGKSVAAVGADGSALAVGVYDTSQAVWVQDSGTSGYLNTGLPAFAEVIDVPIFGSTYTAVTGATDPVVTWCDCAKAGNYLFFSWVAGNSGAATDDVFVSVREANTDTWPMVARRAYSTAQYATKAKCGAAYNVFIVVWLNNSAELRFSAILATDPTVFAATNTLIANNVLKFDVCLINSTNRVWAVAYESTANDLYTAVIEYPNTVLCTSAAHHPAVHVHDIVVNSPSITAVDIYNTDGIEYRNVHYHIAWGGPTITYQSNAAVIPYVGVPRKLPSGGEGVDYTHVSEEPPTTYDYETNILEFGSTAGGHSNTNLIRGCTALSGFSACHYMRVFVAQHVDLTQRALLVINFDKYASSIGLSTFYCQPIARILAGYGISPALVASDGAKYLAGFDHALTISAPHYCACFPVIAGYRADLGTPITGIRAVLLTISDEGGAYNHDHHVVPRSVEFNGLTLLSGSQPHVFDGRMVTDLGFAWNPEPCTVSAINHASGALTAGTYSVKAIYVWYTTKGHRCESGVSPAYSVTIAAPNDAIRVIVPTLSCRSGDTNVVVEVYRTAVGGTTYYYAGSTGVCLAPTSASVTVELYAADTTITDNRQLYTEGGVLANDTLSACSAMNVRRDRVFAATGEYELSYTKTRVDGYGPEFPTEFKINIDRKYGRITALADADGREVIFCERGIFYFDGDGPNDLGQGEFTDIRDVVSPVGAVMDSPTLASSLGVWFVSGRGIELLGRDLSVVFKGAPLQNALTGNVVDIVPIQPQSEIWFFTDSGTHGVYHVDFDAWSTSEIRADVVRTISAQRACLCSDDTVALLPVYQVGVSQAVWLSDPTIYTDNALAATTSYTLLIDTAWLALAGKQGWQRVYNVALVGEYKAGHVFTVGVYYDYNETVAETVTLTVAADPNPEQLIFKPAKQKCQAIRFRITDATPSGTQASFALSHLQLEVGVKGGIARV